MLLSITFYSLLGVSNSPATSIVSYSLWTASFYSLLGVSIYKLVLWAKANSTGSRLSTPFWEFQEDIGRSGGQDSKVASFYSLLGVSLKTVMLSYALLYSQSFLLPFGSFLSKVRAVAVDEVTVTLSTPFWEFRAMFIIWYMCVLPVIIAFYSLLGVSGAKQHHI